MFWRSDGISDSWINSVNSLLFMVFHICAIDLSSRYLYNKIDCNYSEPCKSGQYVRRMLAFVGTFGMIYMANVGYE